MSTRSVPGSGRLEGGGRPEEPDRAVKVLGRDAQVVVRGGEVAPGAGGGPTGDLHRQRRLRLAQLFEDRHHPLAFSPVMSACPHPVMEVGVTTRGPLVTSRRATRQRGGGLQPNAPRRRFTWFVKCRPCGPEGAG